MTAALFDADVACTSVGSRGSQVIGATVTLARLSRVVAPTMTLSVEGDNRSVRALTVTDFVAPMVPVTANLTGGSPATRAETTFEPGVVLTVNVVAATPARSVVSAAGLTRPAPVDALNATTTPESATPLSLCTLTAKVPATVPAGTVGDGVVTASARAGVRSTGAPPSFEQATSAITAGNHSARRISTTSVGRRLLEHIRRGPRLRQRCSPPRDRTAASAPGSEFLRAHERRFSGNIPASAPGSRQSLRRPG